MERVRLSGKCCDLVNVMDITISCSGVASDLLLQFVHTSAVLLWSHAVVPTQTRLAAAALSGGHGVRGSQRRGQHLPGAGQSVLPIKLQCYLSLECYSRSRHSYFVLTSVS